MNQPYTTFRVRSWNSFAALVDDLSVGWLFRGQRDARWPLQTSIERYAVGIRPEEAERMVIRAFQRRAHLHLPLGFVPSSLIEWLSVMQHHGAPTRLMDWTRSPYVAAFFAVEEATARRGYSAVWAVNAIWSAISATKSLRATETDLGDEDAWSAALFSSSDDSEFYRWINHEPPVTAVLLVDPQRETERLALQQGSLMCPTNLSKSFAENLTQGDDSVDPASDLNFIKIEIPNTLRPVVLENLRRRMNITRATMFPGLDGFAQSLREIIVAPDRVVRVQRRDARVARTMKRFRRLRAKPAR